MYFIDYCKSLIRPLKDVIRRYNYHKLYASISVCGANAIIADNCNICGIISIGKNVNINNSTLNNEILISDSTCIVNTTINGPVKIGTNCYIAEATIDRFSYVVDGAYILMADIGPFSSIGKNVFVGLPVHPIDYVSTSPAFYSSYNQCGEDLVKVKHETNEFVPTKIGADVWIGNASMIKGGVSIGHGAIIGACSLVTKDVPPYSIVGGVPAKIIKYRFDFEIIDKLISSRWWEHKQEHLRELQPYISEPATFLEMLERYPK